MQLTLLELALKAIPSLWSDLLLWVLLLVPYAKQALHALKIIYLQACAQLASTPPLPA